MHEVFYGSKAHKMAESPWSAIRHLKMNKNTSRFTPVIERVSASMRNAYEMSTGTSLVYENNKLIRSDRTLNRISGLLPASGLFGISIIVVILIVIRWYSPINHIPKVMIILGIILVGQAMGCMIYLNRLSVRKAKVRDSSFAILEKFEEAVTALEHESLKPNDGIRLFHNNTIRENLILMAEEVTIIQDMKIDLEDKKVFKRVNKILKGAICPDTLDEILIKALGYQRLFGIEYTRGELFKWAAQRIANGVV